MKQHEKNMEKYLQDLAKWEANKDKEQRDKQSSATKGKDKPSVKPTQPQAPQPRMHTDEPINFLRLATALKMLLSRTVSDQSIARGATLYTEYLFGFKQV